MRKLLLIAVAALFALAYAQAQSGGSGAVEQPPYVKYAEPLRFAFGTEMLGIQLKGLAAANSDVQASAEKDADGALFADSDFLDLFKGSLKVKDADLATQLEQALAAADSALQKGSGVDAAAQKAQGLLKQARDALVPASTQQEPAFQATLIGQLLILDDATADNYEDATEDGDAASFAMAWAGVQRAKALWKTLEPQLDSSKTSTVTGALDQLNNDFVPSATMPKVLKDEDDFEDRADTATYGLGAALGTTLFPHDLSSAMTLLSAQEAAACTDAEAGKLPVAAEGVAAADNTYDQYIGDVLSVVDAGTASKLDTLLDEQLPDAIQKGDTGAIKTGCEQFPDLLKAAKAATQ
jgi:hypothetical protein